VPLGDFSSPPTVGDRMELEVHGVTLGYRVTSAAEAPAPS
jgi:hypothetical protein